ncbi:MAG: hypothetical protein AAF577_06650 [Pseudomonadota bacterium]
MMVAVLVVTFVGDDAIGVVSDLNDREAVHEAAVAAVAERERRREIEEHGAEPRRIYYPDSPEADGGARSAGASPATSASLQIDTRGGGATGAFEPAIAEPRRVDPSSDGPVVPAFDVKFDDTSELVPGLIPSSEQESCLDEVRANPFVSESLINTAGCDAADGPVISEPQRTDAQVTGLAISETPAQDAPAFQFDTPGKVADCDPAVADNPFLTDSLRAAAGCPVGGTAD